MKRYDLDVQRELLWLSSKPVIRDLSRWQVPSRSLSGRVALVLGSQRSGTTLMFLMLTAHPRMTGLDEIHAKFDLPPWPVVAANALQGKRTVYKLPIISARVSEIASGYPHSDLIWMIRHPFAVVASMRNLSFADGGTWLEKYGLEEAEQTLAVTAPHERDALEHLDDIALGATIWKHKLLLLDRYRKAGMRVHPVRYEALVTDPEAVFRELLAGLRLPWSSQVLEHHRFHGDERHAGGTVGTRQVDRSSMDRGDELNESEKAIVLEIAGELVDQYGYDATQKAA
jgi:hypothetical protein